MKTHPPASGHRGAEHADQRVAEPSDAASEPPPPPGRSWFEPLVRPGQTIAEPDGQRTGALLDGRAVAADGGFSVLDADALRESMALSTAQRAELGQEFFSTLFTQSPELRELFPASMQAPRARLVEALMRIADVAHDESRLRPFLRGIGRDHRKYGAVDWHYAAAGRALLPALRRVHGEAWSDRFEQAWAVGYDVLARVAVAAAAEDALVAPPWWDAEVVFHRRVRDDLAVIQVRPHTDYPFRPGQYCEVMSPARERMWRAYAFASAPRADGLLEFHVRAVGAGWVSSALVWRTRPGDVVRLGAPCGGDLAPADAERDLVCVTSGTGIAPVLAALQELERRPDGRKVHVFYAAAGHDDLYALPHLESIAIRYRPLAIVPVLPADGRDDHTAELLRSVVADNGDWRQHDVFVGGPVAITGLALEHLRTIGIPDDRLSHQGHGAP